jgi:hypothetical protein
VETSQPAGSWAILPPMLASSIVPMSLIAGGLFLGLVACLEFWFRLGSRTRHQAHPPDPLVNIQAASLGLLALLLGFSFSQASQRFADRVQLILHEASAIRLLWLRGDLLDAAPRHELRTLLRSYLGQRIAFYDASTEARRTDVIEEAELQQRRLWLLVANLTRARPELADALLPPMDRLVELERSRSAAARSHLPGMFLSLLLGCSFVSVAAVGYGCGVAGQRNQVLTVCLTFLIAATLWAIIDFDHPRVGLIQTGQYPLLELQARLEREPAEVGKP